VARFARQGRKPSHEGAADAKNMNMHGVILGGPSCWAGRIPLTGLVKLNQGKMQPL
jgi:hypothetical protein